MSELRYDESVKKIYSKEEYINACFGGLPNESMLIEQWEKLPIVTIGYDSESETRKHIMRVSELLGRAAITLIERSRDHDRSKLEDPEKPYFDRLTPLLKGLKFGSKEYADSLKELGVALDHHYKHNTHHPQHYESGVNEFCLFDLIEMFFDWVAASERTDKGDIYESIEYNKDRFKLSDQVVAILYNTAKRYL